MISRQFHDPAILAGLKLHPGIAEYLREGEGPSGEPSWNGMILSFTHSSKLEPWKTQERETAYEKGGSAWSDSESRIQRLTEQISKEGLHDPLIMGYHWQSGKAGLEEGHHRLAAIKKLGGMNVPVVGMVKTSAGSGYKQGPQGLIVPDQFGWYPKTVDPSRITG